MAEEIAKNEWGVIVKHPNVLELRWVPPTAPMTDGAFMATLCLLVLEAERARPRGVLIDAQEFRHQLGPSVHEWRNGSVIPRYGAAGVRRFALVAPPGFPQVGKEVVEGPAVFPTRFFAGRDEAFAWLNAT